MGRLRVRFKFFLCLEELLASRAYVCSYRHSKSPNSNPSMRIYDFADGRQIEHPQVYGELSAWGSSFTPVTHDVPIYNCDVTSPQGEYGVSDMFAHLTRLLRLP